MYIGYRYYETVKRDVNIPFGFGLSYTTFELSGLQLQRDDCDDLLAKLMVSVKVKNTGKLDGQDVIQVYVHPHHPGIRRPLRELKGYTKVAVKAGASQTAKVEVPLKYAASYWDEVRESWILEAGKYDIEVTDGTGNQQSLLSTIEVSTTLWWNGL